MRTVGWCVGVVCLAVVSSPWIAMASNETPKLLDGCRLEPYRLAMGGFAVLDELVVVCRGEGYTIADEIESPYHHVRVEDFVYHLTYSTGLFGIATHGSAAGLAVEVFSSQAACDSAYRWYLSHGYGSDELYTARDPQTGYYHIGATSVLIYRCFRGVGKNSIVYNASCNGHVYWSAWVGAREVLGYNGTPTWGVLRDDASTFWGRMGGYGGQWRRSVGEAVYGLQISRSGPGGGKTVVAPSVSYYSPSGAEIDANGVTVGEVAFDAIMDKTISPSTIVVSEGRVSLREIEWDTGWTGDLIKYRIGCNGNGSGVVRVRSFLARSPGGMVLDGNQEPPGTNGVTPNGDDFVIAYRCDDNPATRYACQWAYRAGSGAVVGWHVEAERGTSAYEVEGLVNGGWERLARVSRGDFILPGVYEVWVPSGYDYYRVVEIDELGRQTPSDQLPCLAEEPEIARKVKSIPAMPTKLEIGYCSSPKLCSRYSLAGIRSFASVPDWVIYGPESLVVECMPAVMHLQSCGLQVDTAYAVSPDY